MRFGLKLSHKGLILVCVPLAFELVLLGLLTWLLQQAEYEAQRANRAVAVIEQLSLIQKKFIDAGTTLFAYKTLKSLSFRQHYTDLVSEIPEHFRAVRDLTADNARDRLTVERLGALFNQALDLLDELVRRIDHNDTSTGLGILDVRPEAQSLFKQVQSELQRHIAEERKVEQTSPEAAARLRTAIQQCIFAAAIASIMIAVLLTIFVNQGTIRRLKELMENTRRLARREPLSPAQSGSDEIAELDQVFHDMAAALAESMRKELAAIENAQDVICSIDADGTFTAVSPASAKVWGYPPETLIGRKHADFIFLDDREASIKSFEDIRAGESKISFESRIQKNDSSLTDNLWSVHWSETERLFFCVAHDVTQQKELERLKQQVMNMVTHDLRAPLTSLQIAMGLLNAGACGELPDKAQTKLGTMERSVEWLIDLINDLLDIEKLEAGKMDMNLEVQPLQPILDQACQAVNDLASDHSINLDWPDTELTIRADGARLTQVIINLLGNAIKFSPNGSKVSLSVRRQSNQIEIRVTDQGRGIPAAKRQQIFQRFQQVHLTDSTVKGGTGLGLAICKAIVEAHGGTIDVESEEGIGTTFWFSVPDRRAEPEECPAEEAVSTGQQGSGDE